MTTVGVLTDPEEVKRCTKCRQPYGRGWGWHCTNCHRTWPHGMPCACGVDEHAEWRARVYSNTGSDSYGRRRRPRRRIQLDVLDRQNHKCIYCGLAFDALIRVRNGPIRSLRLHWDHFVPYSYSLRNPDENWVAACDICNRIKGDLMFDTLEKARAFVAERRVAKCIRVIELPELPPMIGGRCECGRHWQGRAEAHCVGCHRHFSSDRAFDEHFDSRTGDCLDPGTIFREDGRPRFSSIERVGGKTWMLAKYPHFDSKARQRTDKKAKRRARPLLRSRAAVVAALHPRVGNGRRDQ